MDLLMSAPGIAAYSGLMIYGEIGEVDRFDRANEVMSYEKSARALSCLYVVLPQCCWL